MDLEKQKQVIPPIDEQKPDTDQPVDFTGSRKESCLNIYFRNVKRLFGLAFFKYGQTVGKWPLPFIIVPLFVLAGLGAGIYKVETEENTEKIYFPKDSRGFGERQKVLETFPDINRDNFNVFSQGIIIQAHNLIFVSKNDENFFGSNIAGLEEIGTISKEVKGLRSSENVYFIDRCARLLATKACVIDGDYAWTETFRQAVSRGEVSYPRWRHPLGFEVELDSALGGVTLNQHGNLTSATVLKLSFVMARDSSSWTGELKKYASGLNPTYSHVYYSLPYSLSDELTKGTMADIKFFIISLVLCCVYASLVSMGGNMVTSRATLALGGILSTVLSIVGSMGLLMACGAKMVAIVGIIPFLIIGIGVDDMFLLMSSWSEFAVEGKHDKNVPLVLGKTLAHAAIGVSITSFTDLLAFLIGTTSVFYGVNVFSLYAAVAVMFCYIANLTMFAGFLAIHGRRVYANRSMLTCRRLEESETARQAGRSASYVYCCTGSPPLQPHDDDSPCENIARRLLIQMVKRKAVCVVVIILFGCYLAVSIYGLLNLKEGLKLYYLVPEDSYYYKYIQVLEKYFQEKLPIAFVIDSPTFNYQKDGDKLLDLMSKARQDPDMNGQFKRCWMTSYHAYLKTKQIDYTSLTPSQYLGDLSSALQAELGQFYGDVAINFNGVSQTIKASRCFVMSKPYIEEFEKANLMERLRSIADSSDLPVFAYHYAFLMYEQFKAVRPATLRLVICAIVVMAVVTFLFLPNFFMVGLVLLTIVMILLGIFGFMGLWGISLSSITMIHLVMSVGFCVDFSIHVCAAYLVSNSHSRESRACDAINHAAGPVVNGAASTMVGVVVLAASKSYLFLVFFKVLFLVIFFGMLHGVFFVPAVLALCGPQEVRTDTKSSVNKPLASDLQQSGTNFESSDLQQSGTNFESSDLQQSGTNFESSELQSDSSDETSSSQQSDTSDELSEFAVNRI